MMSSESYGGEPRDLPEPIPHKDIELSKAQSEEIVESVTEFTASGTLRGHDPREDAILDDEMTRDEYLIGDQGERDYKITIGIPKPDEFFIFLED